MHNCKNNIFVSIFIILLAVSPAFALGEGNKNLLLIGAMCISPYFIIRYPIIIPKIDFPLITLCFLMISFPILFHPETMRWSTVLYSCLFCVFFMAFARLIYHSNYTAEDLLRIMKWLLYAYCVVLIIQQFCVLTGLPIFNLSNYDIKEPWKLNSLMSEPSHSARIIPVLMYLYTILRRHLNVEYSLKESLKERWVWFSFLWSTFTMGSTTAFIFMFIVLSEFIDFKKFLSTIALISIVFISFTLMSNNKYIARARKVMMATASLDEREIIKADHSASFRIVPSILGGKFVGLTALNDWIGYGVDADQELLTPLPTVTKGNAGAFYMWVNYGFIVAIIFWYFSLNIVIIKHNWVSFLLWFLCIFLYGGLNNQIVWLILVITFSFKYVTKTSSSINHY